MMKTNNNAVSKAIVAVVLIIIITSAIAAISINIIASKQYYKQTKMLVATNAITSNAHRPQAIQKEGLTFMIYESMENGDSYIQCYDYRTNNITQPYIVDTLRMFSPDMHWSPAISIINDKLIAFVFGDGINCKLSQYTITEIKQNKTRLQYWQDKTTYTYNPQIGMINYYQIFPFDNERKIAVIYSIQSGETTWWRTEYNETTWQQPIKIFSYIPDRFYMFVTEAKEKLLLTGYETRAVMGGRGENIYFSWSDNYGTTWKKVNGTQFDLPMNTSAKIFNSPVSTLPLPCILDEYDRPTIHCLCYNSSQYHRYDESNPVYLLGDYNIKIVYYTAKLGQSGEWKIDFAKDEQDNLLIMTYCDYVDPYLGLTEGKPTFWMRLKTPNGEYYMTRCVRMANNINHYMTFEDTYTDLTGSTDFPVLCGCSSVAIMNRDKASGFEVFCSEYYNGTWNCFLRGTNFANN